MILFKHYEVRLSWFHSIRHVMDAIFFNKMIQGMEVVMTKICSVLLLETGLAAFDQGNNLIASKKFDNPVHSYRLLKDGKKSAELDQLTETLHSFDSVSVND